MLWLGAHAGASTGAPVTRHVGGGGGEGPAQRRRRKLAASTALALPRSTTVGSLVRPRSCPLLGAFDDAKCAGEGGRGCTSERRVRGCREGEGGRGREGRARCCVGAHHVASRDVRWALTAASGASGEPWHCISTCAATTTTHTTCMVKLLHHHPPNPWYTQGQRPGSSPGRCHNRPLRPT